MSINVEIFASPGCNRCGHAKDIMRELVNELGNDKIQWREVNIIKELDHAVALGVLITPAIAINNKLVFSGMPSAKKLRTELLAQLNKAESLS